MSRTVLVDRKESGDQPEGLRAVSDFDLARVSGENMFLAPDLDSVDNSADLRREVLDGDGRSTVSDFLPVGLANIQAGPNRVGDSSHAPHHPG